MRVKDGDANGRHCIIVDDLVQSGGTLLECAKGLKEQGATRVSCFVTHGVFPNDSWKKFVDTNGLVDTFWLTDTIPETSEAVKGIAPFEILSIAPLVGHLLTGDAVTADHVQQ